MLPTDISRGAPTLATTLQEVRIDDPTLPTMPDGVEGVLQLQAVPLAATEEEVRQWFKNFPILADQLLGVVEARADLPDAVTHTQDIRPICIFTCGEERGTAYVQLADPAQAFNAVQALTARELRVVKDAEAHRRLIVLLSSAEKRAAAVAKNLRHIITQNQLNAMVRLRGLPYSTTEAEVLMWMFAEPSNICTPQILGVTLVRSSSRTPNGNAFVRVSSMEVATKLTALHRRHLGERYVEVYMSTGKDKREILQAGKKVADGSGGGGSRRASQSSTVTQDAAADGEALPEVVLQQCEVPTALRWPPWLAAAGPERFLVVYWELRNERGRPLAKTTAVVAYTQVSTAYDVQGNGTGHTVFVTLPRGFQPARDPVDLSTQPAPPPFDEMPYTLLVQATGGVREERPLPLPQLRVLGSTGSATCYHYDLCAPLADVFHAEPSAATRHGPAPHAQPGVELAPPPLPEMHGSPGFYTLAPRMAPNQPPPYLPAGTPPSFVFGSAMTAGGSPPSSPPVPSSMRAVSVLAYGQPQQPFSVSPSLGLGQRATFLVPQHLFASAGAQGTMPSPVMSVAPSTYAAQPQPVQAYGSWSFAPQPMYVQQQQQQQPQSQYPPPPPPPQQQQQQLLQQPYQPQQIQQLQSQQQWAGFPYAQQPAPGPFQQQPQPQQQQQQQQHYVLYRLYGG